MNYCLNRNTDLLTIVQHLINIVQYLTSSDLQRFEKLLSTFQHYTYNHYAVLQLTLIRLGDFISSKPDKIDVQTQLDLSFEVEHELESLKQIRFEQQKDEAFALHVKAALHIINRLHPYADHIPDQPAKQKLSLFKRLKRRWR